MTDNNHPTIPPLPLTQQWIEFAGLVGINEQQLVQLATQAARWGSDRELEACCEHLKRIWSPSDTIDSLRTARRPKPPSLKEQALKELKDWTDEKHGPGGEVFLCEGLSVALIREALESLPD